MSSDPVSESNLRSLFDAALKEYEKQAGTSLLDNHLVIQLQNCESADAISAVLQEQAQAFHTFRGGDGKLTSWLKRTVNVLYTLSTSSALGAGVGLVRCKLLVLAFQSSNVFDSDTAISTCKRYLRRNRYPSCCMCRFIGLICETLTMSVGFRQSRTSALATMLLSTCSNPLKTF
jgi:hypothetical protein